MTTYSLQAFYNLRRFSQKSDYLDFLKTGEREAQRLIETRLTSFRKLPFKVIGWCGVCDNWESIEFGAYHGTIAKDGAFNLAYSETGVCLKCRCNSRMRASADFIRSILRSVSNPSIYLTEARTNYARALKSLFPNLICSEYLPDVVFGLQDDDGVISQDIENLTFQDNIFDLVGCFDVLEHVANPARAVFEIRRVLKPGGVALLTIPFSGRLDYSVTRAKISEDGKLYHLASPMFHGNPIGDGQSLVFTDFGWDFVKEISDIFTESRFIHYNSNLGYHFGDSRFIWILKK